MIRHATETDIPQLLAMGEQFAAYAGGSVRYSPARAAETIRGLVALGVVLVHEEEPGVIDGGIMGMISRLWYAEDKVATELALWISPESRTGRPARELLKAFEGWAKGQGVKYITMSDLCIDGEYPAGSWFERQGYRAVERTHLKEVS